MLSRVLPVSLDGSLSSTGKLNADFPTKVSEVTKQDEADRLKNIHWFRCTTDPPTDEIVGFDCTMMGYNSPLHRRSPETGGINFPSNEITREHKTENQANVVDLHPCFLETTTGRRRLVCRSVDQALDEISVDAGLQALAVSLVNGLPISIDPGLTFHREFDQHLRRLVSIYPSGDGYNILMTDSPHKTTPIEPCLVTPDLQRGSGKNAYTSLRCSSPAKPLRQKAQGSLEGSLLVRCWFQLNEQTLSAELICALSAGAEFYIMDFADIKFERDSNDNNANEMGSDERDLKASYARNTDPAGNLTKRGSDLDERRINNTYFKRQSSPEILVDRWFLCWTGSGPKMLCEIPDWYTGDDHHPQSKHMRKVTLQTHGGKVYTPLLSPTLPRTDMALHFLVDSPPLWHHCRSASDPGSYAMRCIDESTHRAMAQRNRVSKSKENNRILHLRNSDMSTHPPRKGGLIEPPHNTTSHRCGPGRISAFGKMGETFAFIGFFTVLVVFTVVLSWLVKHLFLAIYDGLEEWTTSRRRKKTLASSKDFGISSRLNDRVPIYDFTDRGFQRSVNTVPFPQTAVMNEEATAAISTTGSQTVDGVSDSIKRKKAAMRATVSEEIEP